MTLVPSKRLLWLVFYAALVGVGAGPLPELTPVWLLALGGVVLVAMVDAALSVSRARPPEASVPPVVRFMRDREGALPVTFSAGEARGDRRDASPGSEGAKEVSLSRPLRGRRLRVALGLPAVFASRDEEVWVDWPEGAEQARIDWHCTPRRRGRFTDVLVCVEGGSVLGLWHVRVRQQLSCELRVHPNLLSERKHIAALFLARGRPGARVQRTLGRGREFEKLREYLPGDGFDEIHWKASAKRGRPVTKVFQAERTQEIYVVIDASRLSVRPVSHGGIEQTLLERHVTSALVLLVAAERQGDKFGLVAHDDRVRICVRAGSGARHYAACRDAMLALKPTEATPDMPEIVRQLRARFRQRALLFFLTDLSDPVLAEDFVAHVRVLARQHLVIVGQLPAPEVAPLFAGGEVETNDDVYRRLAGHMRWAETRTLARKLKPLGVHTVMLENETMAAQLVAQYMEIKERQAL